MILFYWNFKVKINNLPPEETTVSISPWKETFLRGREMMKKRDQNLLTEERRVGDVCEEMNLFSSHPLTTGNFEEILSSCYIVDQSTRVSKDILPFSTMKEMDLTLQQKKQVQILIYHTHGSETYQDGTSVVEVGSVLAKQLRSLGWKTYHDTTGYDKKGGALDRSAAYTYALEGIQKKLKRYPEVQVLIDLHRDGVPGTQKNVISVEGKGCAPVMFFNGLCEGKEGPMAGLRNPNRTGNLAFSFQLLEASIKTYPGLCKKIYLKNYRYNLHLKKRALLVELGNQNNTGKEAKEAMKPLAKLLDQVLQEKP